MGSIRPFLMVLMVAASLRPTVAVVIAAEHLSSSPGSHYGNRDKMMLPHQVNAEDYLENSPWAARM